MYRIKFILITVSFFLIVLGHLFGHFLPVEYSWGFNFFAFFPESLLYIMSIVVFLIFIPAFNRSFQNFIVTLFGHKPPESLLPLGLMFISLIIFSLGINVTHFLGDGYLWLRTIPDYYPPYASEILNLFLHRNLYLLLNRTIHTDALFVYRLTSIISGVFFIYIMFHLSRLLTSESIKKVFIFLNVTTSGFILLFFGYVEHYPLVLTTILLYLYLSLRYLKDCSHPILPSITLGIALSLHLISILLFPSLIYQYIVRLKFRSLRFWLYSFLPLVIYFSILSLILFFGNKPLNEVLREYHLLPLFSSQKEEYSIFSVPHIIDLFNLYLLIGPLGLIMLFWGMVFFFKKSDINNPVVIFLAVAFVSFFIYSFIFNPDKGWARDWDLFTFVGLLSTIFGGYLFCRFEDSKKFGYLTVVIIATVLLHTIPWVIINRSQSMSLKRFQQLMAVNPEKSGSAHEELAIYFRDQKLYHQAEQEHLAAIKVLPYNGRYWAQLGYLYTLMNEPTKATYAYQQSLAVDPENHREHINLGNVYRSVGEYRLALLHYQKALEIDSTLWPAYFNKGLVFTDIGYIDSAIAAYEKGLRFNKQNFDIYFNLGTLYATQKEYGLAIKNLKQATMLKANDPQVHYNLGLALFGNQCYQAAIDEYKVVIKLKPDFAEAFNNLGLAYEKIGDTLQAENCYRSALRINPKLSQPWYNLQRLKR